MALKDTGHREDFGTGAVREVGCGKGRFDLMPLGIFAEVLHDDTVKSINDFIYTGDEKHLFDALNSGLHNMGAFTSNYDMMLEVAHQYEEGAIKYGLRNWEHGMPLHTYIDSATRHYMKEMRGDKDEPHARAFVWNIVGAIFALRYSDKSLRDLPFAQKDMDFVTGKEEK